MVSFKFKVNRFIVVCLQNNNIFFLLGDWWNGLSSWWWQGCISYPKDGNSCNFIWRKQYIKHTIHCTCLSDWLCTCFFSWQSWMSFESIAEHTQDIIGLIFKYIALVQQYGVRICIKKLRKRKCSLVSVWIYNLGIEFIYKFWYKYNKRNFYRLGNWITL